MGFSEWVQNQKKSYSFDEQNQFPTDLSHFSMLEMQGIQTPKEYSLGFDKSINDEVSSFDDMIKQSSPTDVVSSGMLGKAGIEAAGSFLSKYFKAKSDREALEREMGRQTETIRAKNKQDILLDKSNADQRSFGNLIAAMKSAMIRR